MLCGFKVRAVSRRALLVLHFAGILVPSILFINLVYATLLLFIPIMGRAGTASYPDLFIGCLTVSAVILLSVWQVTLCIFIRVIFCMFIHVKQNISWGIVVAGIWYGCTAWKLQFMWFVLQISKQTWYTLSIFLDKLWDCFIKIIPIHLQSDLQLSDDQKGFVNPYKQPCHIRVNEKQQGFVFSLLNSSSMAQHTW